MNKGTLIMIALLSARSFLYAQVTNGIDEKKAGGIIQYLASDSLKGRGNLSPDLLKACMFIEDKFRQSKLLPLTGMPYYTIAFRPYGGSVPDQLVWNGKKTASRRFRYLHEVPGEYPKKTLKDFTVIQVRDFFDDSLLQQLPDNDSDLLLWTDKSPSAKPFPDLMPVPATGFNRDVLMVYADQPPADLSLSPVSRSYVMTQYNVVGMLPGKSKPDEMIVFAAHYDHMGVFGKKGDNILNGANDNASGTTALIMLASYFAQRNDNERTLLFCAFSGEEVGLLGSKDFVQYIDPQKIIAGINLEMLGVSQYGENTVFVTGERFSDLPRHLEENLKENKISVVAEPDVNKLLFQRSDNYPFALKGVPFHTIMGSDDDEKCYHQPCDDIKRIDVSNMTRIIQGIAGAVQPLIKGEFTPQRINPAVVEVEE